MCGGEEDGDIIGALPEGLQAEFHALTRALCDGLVPEGFTFEAKAGYNEQETICPRFRLFHQVGGKSSDSYRGDFVPNRSLIEQLQELSWKEQRAKAVEHKQTLEAVKDLLDQLSKPTIRAEASRSFSCQKTGYFLQHFFQEARADISSIHVLYREDLQVRPSVEACIQPLYREEGEMQTMASFNTLDELREILPSLVMGNENIISVVAWENILSSYFLDRLQREGRQMAEICYQPHVE